MLCLSVVIRKDRRGRGFGRKIMEETEEHARRFMISTMIAARCVYGRRLKVVYIISVICKRDACTCDRILRYNV